MYDLSALVAAQVEFGEEGLLLCVQLRQAGGRARLMLAGLAGIDQQDFLDAAQQFECSVHAQIQALLVEGTLEQGGERQGQHAIEGMDPDFTIGPVKHRRPTQEVGVLHVPEGALDLVLRAVAGDHLLVGPGVVVGKENGFAQVGAHEAGEGGGVGAIGQGRHGAGLHPPAEQGFEELAAEDLLHPPGDRLDGGGLAAFDPPQLAPPQRGL